MRSRSLGRSSASRTRNGCCPSAVLSVSSSGSLIEAPAVPGPAAFEGANDLKFDESLITLVTCPCDDEPYVEPLRRTTSSANPVAASCSRAKDQPGSGASSTSAVVRTMQPCATWPPHTRPVPLATLACRCEPDGAIVPVSVRISTSPAKTSGSGAPARRNRVIERLPSGDDERGLATTLCDGALERAAQVRTGREPQGQRFHVSQAIAHVRGARSRNANSR